DLVPVVLAVEQVFVDPGAAAGEQVRAGGGELVVAEVPGHLLGGPQRGQVPDADLRVRAEVLDVHGVVLGALHDAVAVGVPAAGDPGELQRPAGGRPERAQQVVVAAEPPLAVQLHQAAHLPVRGGDAV